jgi:hypothetical protein
MKEQLPTMFKWALVFVFKFMLGFLASLLLLSASIRFMGAPWFIGVSWAFKNLFHLSATALHSIFLWDFFNRLFDTFYTIPNMRRQALPIDETLKILSSKTSPYFRVINHDSSCSIWLFKMLEN